MSRDNGLQSNSGAPAQTPAAYAPVSAPLQGPDTGLVAQLQQGLAGSQPPPSAPPPQAPMTVNMPNGGFPQPMKMDASAIQMSGGNPFALGGRAYGNYVPPQTSAPDAQPAMTPRYGGGFMRGVMPTQDNPAPQGGLMAPGMGRGNVTARGRGAL